MDEMVREITERVIALVDSFNINPDMIRDVITETANVVEKVKLIKPEDFAIKVNATEKNECSKDSEIDYIKELENKCLEMKKVLEETLDLCNMFYSSSAGRHCIDAAIMKLTSVLGKK